MTKFKNVFLLAAMAVSAVCVASCSDDDDKPAAGGGSLSITAVVENGSEYNDLIDEVRVVVGDVTVTGKYAKGGFTIVLPASVPDKYLEDRGGIKMLGISADNFRPYDKNGVGVDGRFRYSPDDSPWFMYVDRDAARDNLSLKKGWNIVYFPDNKDGNMTSTPPSGFTDKWSFSYYGN
ncbi:hypothetical protein AGMMS4957_01350 [Bacteroidia bacterium]|nr:hypothetical protein AGMMS4957_01350 [Bacteroidia bacterium]